MVKRSIEQDIRNKNFGARNGNYETNAVAKNQGTKQRGQRTLGDCWQWKANGQCVKGDNCSFRHDINKRAKPTSRILLRDLLRGRMKEMHREPEVPEARVPVVECVDGPARITLKELAPLHSVKSGTLQNACSTRPRVVADVGKSARMHWRRMIGAKMYGTLLSTLTRVTKDRGDLIRIVIMSWNEHLLDVDHRTHDNWVVSFTTWSRRSLFHGRARRNQSNVWKSRRLLYVTLNFETKTLRSDIFAQVKLISAAPTLQNLRIGLRKRQSGKS